MPRAGSALFQNTAGRQGNFELVVTNNSSSYSGALSGGLLTMFRDNDGGMVWRRDSSLTFYDAPGSSVPAPYPVPVDRAYRFPCWIQASDGHFHGVCVLGSTVRYFAREMSGAMIHDLPMPGGTVREAIPTGSDPLPANCVGAPAFLQSRYGVNGNFEIAAPVAGGGMDHFWCNNDRGLPRRLTGAVLAVPWHRAGRFGRGNPVDGVRLIHSDLGNIEAVALERNGTRRELVFYAQGGPGGRWSAGVVLPGSERVGGLPGFIQSSFQSTPGQGNLEVVAPAADGGLLHWFSFLDAAGTRVWQRAPDINPGGTRVRAVHLIQSNFGGNLEVVAETGASPYGFGSLVFYFFDTRARGWRGPFPITPA